MIKRERKDFDLHQISDSGQCFRMRQIGENAYSLIAHGNYLEVSQTEKEVHFSCSQEEFEEIWKSYFDWDEDYKYIKDSVDKKDAYMQQAVRWGEGIRILRQELWETLVTFLISQCNNIPRIKKCVESLCTFFGEKKTNFREESYFAFPTPRNIASLKDGDLDPCRLGYRKKYILESAKHWIEEEMERQILEADYEIARKLLMKLPGVGIKVADCVCLFALHHIQAFPIDTHIKEILKVHYPEGFPFEKYKGYAGILQQYAFFYDLKKHKLIENRI